MPGGSGRSSLRFAITDDAGHNQVGIIHGSSKGGCQGIAQLPSLVNSSWNTWIEMAWKSAGPGKAAHKVFNSSAIERQLWIEFMQGAFYIQVCQIRGSTMPRSRDQKHIDVVALDEMVEVSIDQVDTRPGAPVTQQAVIDMLRFQWFLKQHVRFEINLCSRKVVGDAPVAGNRIQLRTLSLADVLYCNLRTAERQLGRRNFY